jgi:hypothetical protein
MNVARTSSSTKLVIQIQVGIPHDQRSNEYSLRSDSYEMRIKGGRGSGGGRVTKLERRRGEMR